LFLVVCLFHSFVSGYRAAGLEPQRNHAVAKAVDALIVVTTKLSD
jgi:hypothetical protein